MLILLLIFVIALFLVPVLVKKLGELVGVVVMLHVLVMLAAPGDGGRWASLTLFLLGCFDCGLWLFRRELSVLVRQEDGNALVTRFGIVLAPIAIAFLTTLMLT
ncbi:hypothetical protein [Bremerella sp.]|uniref:hypothetical protein n=1 Tax=Bremerella sp. TaxID=2795602 RepID=UPI00391CD8A7